MPAPLLPAVRRFAPSVSVFLRGRPSPVPLASALPEISRHRIVVFGERHHQPGVLKAQLALLAGLADKLDAAPAAPGGKLRLVLEMFAFSQQPLLDRFIDDPSYAPEELQRDYDASGREGFDLQGHYGFLLQLARELNCGLKAGFLPKDCARLAMSDLGELGKVAEHYAYFEAMIKGFSGRPPPGSPPPTGEMRRIFPAQIAKDASMASAVDAVLRCDPAARVLAVCGNGHSDYGYGVPERLDAGWGKPFLFTARSRREAAKEGGGADWDEEAADALVIYDTNDDSEEEEQ